MLLSLLEVVAILVGSCALLVHELVRIVYLYARFIVLVVTYAVGYGPPTVAVEAWQ